MHCRLRLLNKKMMPIPITGQAIVANVSDLLW